MKNRELTSSTLALAFAKDSPGSDGMNDEHVFGEGRRRRHGRWKSQPTKRDENQIGYDNFLAVFVCTIADRTQIDRIEEDEKIEAIGYTRYILITMLCELRKSVGHVSVARARKDMAARLTVSHAITRDGFAFLFSASSSLDLFRFFSLSLLLFGFVGNHDRVCLSYGPPVQYKLPAPG